MSSIDLIIMGILKRISMSAYDLAQFVEEKKINQWVKISTPAIYQNIKKLANKGYLNGRTVKEGEMPEKTIYNVTTSGEEYFLKLMLYFSINPGRSYADYNTFIVNIDQVEKSVGLEMLYNLQNHIQEWIKGLDEHKVNINEYPLGKRAIIKQYSMICKTMKQWIEELIEEYKNT